MPTYAYQCQACRHVFEKSTHMNEHDQARKPACPKCGSHKVQPRPSSCQVVTGSKA